MDTLSGLWPAIAIARLLGQCPILAKGPPYRRQVSASLPLSIISALLFSVYLAAKIYFLPPVSFKKAATLAEMLGILTALITCLGLHAIFIKNRKCIADLLQKCSNWPSPENLRRNIIIGILFLIISMGTINCLETVNWILCKYECQSLWKMLYIKFLHLEEFANISSQLIFIGFVQTTFWQIKQQVNDELETLRPPSHLEIIEPIGFPISKSEVSYASPADRVIAIRAAHLRMCNLTSEINATFSVVNLLNVTSTFIWLTYVTYLLIAMVLDQNTPITMFFIMLGWLIVQIVRVCSLALVCSHTYAEADKTSEYVHKLLITAKDPQFKEELQLFSIQLIHKKIQFSASGFFPIDNTMIFSIIGATTTYIIILLQFQISSNNNNNHNHNNNNSSSNH